MEHSALIGEGNDRQTFGGYSMHVQLARVIGNYGKEIM